MLFLDLKVRRTFTREKYFFKLFFQHLTIVAAPVSNTLATEIHFLIFRLPTLNEISRIFSMKYTTALFRN